MSAPLKFYRFRETQGWKGSQPVVGIADKSAVRELIGADEMSGQFGGYVEYEDRSSGTRLVGVWSERVVGHFLAFLRERTEVEVVECSPQLFRQHYRASVG